MAVDAGALLLCDSSHCIRASDLCKIDSTYWLFTERHAKYSFGSLCHQKLISISMQNRTPKAQSRTKTEGPNPTLQRLSGRHFSFSSPLNTYKYIGCPAILTQKPPPTPPQRPKPSTPQALQHQSRSLNPCPYRGAANSILNASEP